MSDTNLKPFTSNAQYIEAETQYLAVRARRIEAEQHERQIVAGGRSSDDCMVGTPERSAAEQNQHHLAALRQEEASLRQQIDARLAAHRTDSANPRLGLDDLCETYGLGPLERVLLLLTTISALSKERADEVLDPVGWAYAGSVTVECGMRLMDARTMQERFDARMIVEPGAPLLREEMVSLDLGHRSFAEDRLSARVYLRSPTFRKIMGLPTESHTEPDDSPKGSRRSRQA